MQLGSPIRLSGVTVRWRLFLNWKILTLKLILLLILTGCTKPNPVKTEVIPPQFNGNYTTQVVRQLWQMCSWNFQMKQPSLSPIMRQILCDCYTDTIRADFTPEEIKDEASIKAKGLTNRLVEKCNLKIQPPPKIDT